MTEQVKLPIPALPKNGIYNQILQALQGCWGAAEPVGRSGGRGGGGLTWHRLEEQLWQSPVAAAESSRAMSRVTPRIWRWRPWSSLLDLLFTSSPNVKVGEVIHHWSSMKKNDFGKQVTVTGTGRSWRHDKQQKPAGLVALHRCCALYCEVLWRRPRWRGDEGGEDITYSPFKIHY